MGNITGEVKSVGWRNLQVCDFGMWWGHPEPGRNGCSGRVKDSWGGEARELCMFGPQNTDVGDGAWWYVTTTKRNRFMKSQ